MNNHTHHKIIVFVIISSLLILILSALNLKIGAIHYTWQEVLQALLHPHAHQVNTINIIKSKLPIILTGIIAGSGLAISGLLLQHLTRNPLACPSLFGIEYATALCVILCYMLMPTIAKPHLIMIASSGGVLTFLLMFILAKRMHATTIGITLIGVVFNALYYSAIQAIMIAFPSQSQAILYNISGSLYGSSLSDIGIIIIPFSLFMIISYFCSKHLSYLELDESQAIALGVPIKRFRLILLGLSILLATMITSIIGPLLFFGLIIPHFVRPFFRDQQAVIACGMTGAVVLLLAELSTKLISPQTPLPAGTLILLAAAPILILVTKKYVKYDF